MIYQFGNYIPQIHARSYIAHSADIIGQVNIGEYASIWFGAILRADNDIISIGARSNIQDASVLHVDPGTPLIIGDDVTVGHSAMLHGCAVGDGSLIGIGSRILNHAKIGRHCIIGANTLITEHKIIADRSLVIGSPGKVVRQLTNMEVQSLGEFSAHYVEKIKRYQTELKPINN